MVLSLKSGHMMHAIIGVKGKRSEISENFFTSFRMCMKKQKKGREGGSILKEIEQNEDLKRIKT